MYIQQNYTAFYRQLQPNMIHWLFSFDQLIEAPQKSTVDLCVHTEDLNTHSKVKKGRRL